MYQSRFGILPRTSTFDEPWMLVRGVIRDKIEDHFQTGRVRGVQEGLYVGHRAKQRFDAGVVGNVVAKISHRRGKDRRQPKRINPEGQQIGQPIDDASDIANAIRVGVLKRPRVDLIENAALPARFGTIGHLGNIGENAGLLVRL